MSEIKIPAVGESITSGFLSEWSFEDGAAVNAGDILLILETDKISTEITAEVSGKLKILIPAGEEVEIGTVVGEIEEGVAGDAPAPSPEPAPEPKAEPEPEPEKSPAPEPAPEPKPEPKPETPAAAPVAKPAPVKKEVSAPSKPAADDGRAVRKRMSPLRRKIATQLVAAQRTAAILSTFNECDMSAVMTLRKQVQEGFVAKHGVKLGFMSIFIKAVVEGLKEVPDINAKIDGDEIVNHNRFDIGVAVGTEKGLVVPVVRDCDTKSPAEIELDIADYAKRAREGKITLEDLQGGVFTISNGGIYGSLLSTPILNPPQSGILGMHAIQERPVAIDGEVVIRPMMYLALSYDHRIVDGKGAVTFLIKVKEVIERPAGILM